MRRVAAAVLCCVLAGCADGATSMRQRPIAEIVDTWRQRTPTPGVVVAVGGADMQTYSSGTWTFDSDRRVDADDRFRIASITKLFVATTVVQLVDEGRLSLDARARDVVSAVDGVDSDDLSDLLQGVTVRHLLSHTSGIPDYGLAEGFTDAIVEDRARRWTAGEVLNLVAGRSREFAAGRGYSYSNTNFVLLGAIIERATGASWVKAVRDRIIDPLELSDTYVAGVEPGGHVVPGWFDLDGDSFEEVIPGEGWPSLETSEGAAGAMVSTAHDVLTFGQALFGGRLVSDRGLAAMTQHDPRSPWLAGYGLGTEVGHPDYTTAVWGHGGSLPGHRSLLWHVPSTGTTIVVLTNAYRSNPSDLAELVLRARGDLA